jgi:hypothetical protein
LVLPIIAYSLSSTKLEIRAKQVSAWKQGGGEKGGAITQLLYAHMNKRNLKINK